MPPFSV